MTPLVAAGRGYVVVDRLDSERELRVDAGSTLDGYPLEPWLEQPRALDAAGCQLPNRFAVLLQDARALGAFAPSQVRVFFSGSARSAAGIGDGRVDPLAH